LPLAGVLIYERQQELARLRHLTNLKIRQDENAL